MTADEWDATDRFREMVRAVTDPPGTPTPAVPSPKFGLIRRLFARPAAPPDPPAGPPRLTKRQLERVVAGCCRLGVYGADDLPDHLTGLTLATAADLIERMADGTLTAADRDILTRLDEMRMRVHWPSPADRVLSLVDNATMYGFIAHIDGDFMQDMRNHYLPRVSAAAAGVLRCVLGNPFRPPVAFDRRWRTANAVGLAESMHAANDFGPMPILADALQDAGCEDGQVLAHCRRPGPHVRGCWVVDLVTGKR